MIWNTNALCCGEFTNMRMYSLAPLFKEGSGRMLDLAMLFYITNLEGVIYKYEYTQTRCYILQ